MSLVLNELNCSKSVFYDRRNFLVYSAIQYLLGVVSNFCGSLLMTLLSIGLAYQYGHACDKVDGVTVDRDIENFEELRN